VFWCVFAQKGDKIYCIKLHVCLILFRENYLEAVVYVRDGGDEVCMLVGLVSKGGATVWNSFYFPLNIGKVQKGEQHGGREGRWGYVQLLHS
jgi:hypothetical protein